MIARRFLADAVLVIRLVRHDIRAQRRETLFGALWLFLWPVVQAGGFVLAFDLIRGTSSSLATVGTSYLGILVWSTTSSVLTSGLAMLRINKDMITQIIFPFYVLAVVDVTVKYVFFLVQVVLALTAWYIWKDLPGGVLSILSVIGFCIGFYLFLVALGWAASLAGTVAPDLSYFLPSVLMLLIGLSPIFQPNAAALPRFLRIANVLNPLAEWVNFFYASSAVRDFNPTAALWGLLYGSIAFVAAACVVRYAYRELAKLL